MPFVGRTKSSPGEFVKNVVLYRFWGPLTHGAHSLRGT